MNELLWALMLSANFIAILLCYRFFGKLGLYIWIPISVIIANIQVLKTVELFGLTATLGNIVYATSFLATDILGENYQVKDARRAVYIGFFALISMTVFMNIALSPDGGATSQCVPPFRPRRTWTAYPPRPVLSQTSSKSRRRTWVPSS